jgi:hypothetical protein
VIRRPLKDPDFVARLGYSSLSSTSEESTASAAELAADNARLRKKLQAKESGRAAEQYLKAIRQAMRRGLSRPKAVAEASRRFPAGRMEFLRSTNHPSAMKQLTHTPRVVNR